MRLNGEARSDIRWWDTFADTWNGVGLLATLGHVQPSIQVQSDAAGSWGCGATWHSKWLQFRWHKEMSDFPIATKEMYPVVLAAFIWGQWWSGQHVLFQVDNNTVAAAVRSGSCRERRVMQLLRVLHFVAAKYQFTFTAEHILGSDNPVADAISRDSVPKAFSLSPQLEQVPDHVPAAIIRLLRAPASIGHQTTSGHSFSPVFSRDSCQHSKHVSVRPASLHYIWSATLSGSGATVGGCSVLVRCSAGRERSGVRYREVLLVCRASLVHF